MSDPFAVEGDGIKMRYVTRYQDEPSAAFGIAVYLSGDVAVMLARLRNQLAEQTTRAETADSLILRLQQRIANQRRSLSRKYLGWAETKVGLQRTIEFLRAKITGETPLFGHGAKDAELSALTAKLAAVEKERDEAVKRIPHEMPECTILFKECSKGHGHLTATNWVQHDCQTCQLASAREALEAIEYVIPSGCYRLCAWCGGDASHGGHRDGCKRQQALRELGETGELPTTAEMSGCDPDFTGSLSTKEYLDEIRGVAVVKESCVTEIDSAARVKGGDQL